MAGADAGRPNGVARTARMAVAYCTRDALQAGGPYGVLKVKVCAGQRKKQCTERFTLCNMCGVTFAFVCKSRDAVL